MDVRVQEFYGLEVGWQFVQTDDVEGWWWCEVNAECISSILQMIFKFPESFCLNNSCDNNGNFSTQM